MLTSIRIIHLFKNMRPPKREVSFSATLPVVHVLYLYHIRGRRGSSHRSGEEQRSPKCMMDKYDVAGRMKPIDEAAKCVVLVMLGDSKSFYSDFC